MDATPEPGFDAESIADDQSLPRVLLAALEETASSVCITTADLEAPGPTIVYVNPAYCRMTKRARADIIGRSPRIMQGPLTDRRVLDRLRDDLAAGRRFSGATVNYRADGAPFRIAWSIDPVADPAGGVTHFVATQRDVTAEVATERLRAAEEGLDAALVDALATPDDSTPALSRLLQGIADGASHIAEYGSVEVSLRDPVLGLVSATATGESTSLTSPATASIRIPISRLDTTAIGSITVAHLHPEERDVVDRRGLTRFAERAGSVIGALAEYRRQRRTALRLQEAILPRIETAPDGFDIATVYLPGADGIHVGGDWFDVVETERDVAVLVGDVSGHGIDAATTMARLQTLASAELQAGRSEAEMFMVLDRACRDDGTMATLALARVDRQGARARVWSAGHLPPVRIGPDGADLVRVTPAPPLGHLRDELPTATVLDLADDSGLVLYTDGLVERRGEPLTIGLERLRSTLATSGPVPERVLDELRTLGPADDDTAVVAIRRTVEADREPERVVR